MPFSAFIGLISLVFIAAPEYLRADWSCVAEGSKKHSEFRIVTECPKRKCKVSVQLEGRGMDEVALGPITDHEAVLSFIPRSGGKRIRALLHDRVQSDSSGSSSVEYTEILSEEFKATEYSPEIHFKREDVPALRSPLKSNIKIRCKRSA